MTHGDRRRLFTLNIALLIQWAHSRDERLALGRGQTPRTNDYSLHPDGLAEDMHLYIENTRQSSVTEDNPLGLYWSYRRSTKAHYRCGQFWKSLHPDNRWGGDFKKKDGNHYSMTYRGRA